MPATANINVRTTPERRAVIDQAVEVLGCNRSEFVLEAAEERAREVLLDRTSFALDAERHAKFMEMIDQPLPENSKEALTRLLGKTAPWE